MSSLCVHWHIHTKRAKIADSLILNHWLHRVLPEVPGPILLSTTFSQIEQQNDDYPKAPNNPMGGVEHLLIIGQVRMGEEATANEKIKGSRGTAHPEE